jgi:hypothetical protein
MAKARNAHKTLAQRLKVRDHLEDLDVDGRILLKLVPWMV